MNIPRSTYRLQLNKAFTFKNALKIIPYLSDLGISHVYASPIFKARKGSMHGYDVTDPTTLNPELGSREEFLLLISELGKKGIGWIQDIVPNHMAFDNDNHLLMNLLENGPRMLPAQYFDIEWMHQYEGIRGKLLAPLLGDIYGDCLERGEITLKYDRNGFCLQYYEHRFPLKIDTYTTVLSHDLEKLKAELGGSHSGLIKLLGVLYAIKNLPSAHEIEIRKAQTSFTKEMLWELYTTDPAIHSFINTTIMVYNGTPGKPESFTLLDELHSEQLFKLSYWKVANEELNYRRFFTVNDLISVRVENEMVFHESHELIFDLVNQGAFSGLRVDHIDGLYDPHTYLERLRKGAPETYIVVEKILGHAENLPTVWPIQGTTGYDYLNYVNEVLCDHRYRRRFDHLYNDITGRKNNFGKLFLDEKRIIISKHMAGDIDNLALLIKKVSGKDRRGTDITLYGLRKALVELLAAFPVYRSYISGKLFSADDKAHLMKAISDAKKSDPGLVQEFAFIERFLLLRYEPYASEDNQDEWTQVVMRFQQFTGPLMAKGFEDTMLYNFNRLASLNEVGGWPEILGINQETFHHFNIKRMRYWPNTMNCTSTHDTKRGEDTRARINVLSEIPPEWEKNFKSWCKINLRYKTFRGDEPIPDTNDEYFFYQNLIGCFPQEEYGREEFTERMREYMLKAVKEAKVHTEWIKSDVEYEAGLVGFVNNVLNPEISDLFFKEFMPFQRKIAQYGMYNSLSQCLLKLTSPGVPDFYQGSELWDFSLVDPDNRRSVDFVKRTRLLAIIRKIHDSEHPAFLKEIMNNWQNGLIKLYLITKVLSARNEYLDLFRDGHYIPLPTGGKYKENIIAYARTLDEQWGVTVVPRLLTCVVDEHTFPLTKKVWNDTYIQLPDSAPSKWTNHLTGELLNGEKRMEVGMILEKFPVSLLVSV